MQSWRQIAIRRLVPLLILVGVVVLLVWFTNDRGSSGHKLRVMSYSSFIGEWGPGPELAKLFAAKHGIEIEYHDAGDAGLILEKMRLFPVDVVVGLDRLMLDDARTRQAWRQLSSDVLPASDKPFNEFVPFDYAPIAFVYRKGEIEPPKSLEDLRDPRFKGAIALQDPRTSSPGQLFFFWVLDEMGIEKGFEFLASLKPNIAVVAGGWSGAYGAFQKGKAKIVLSFATSPVYHWMDKNERQYQYAAFDSGHIVQTEFAAIPLDCGRCEKGEEFLSFLRSPEAQAIIMKKNVMLPVDPAVRAGTAFADLEEPKTREFSNVKVLLDQRTELFERWRSLGL